MTDLNHSEINKRTVKGKGYKEFFDKHRSIIRSTKAVCAECGCRLKGNYDEVAHILPKSKFKSIAKNDDNIIYLCPQHHGEYDNESNSSIQKMKIFPFVSKMARCLLDMVEEKYNYKITERWQI